MTRERRAAERLAVKGFCTLALLLAALWAVPQVWDKLSPFIISVPLAAALQPVIRFMSERLKFRRSLAVLICVLLMVAVFLGITYWLVVLIVDQAPQLVGRSGTLLNDAVDAIHRLTESFSGSETIQAHPEVQAMFENAVDQAVSGVTAWGSDAASKLVSFTVNFVTGMPYMMIYLSFLAMALYFITIHYGEIRSYLPGGKRRNQYSNTTQLTNSTIRSLMGYLRVQGTFAIMVFLLSAVALSIFRFKNPVMLGLLAGLMEMVPMVGSGLLYILMGIAYFLIGQTTAAIQVLALTATLQLLRRLLEPKLMSDSIGITPLESLVGMFVGMRVGGIIGLIGGPVLMSVLVGAIHGDMLSSMKEDMQTVIAWLKNRWSEKNQEITPSEEENGQNQPAIPPEATEKPQAEELADPKAEKPAERAPAERKARKNNDRGGAEPARPGRKKWNR